MGLGVLLYWWIMEVGMLMHSTFISMRKPDAYANSYGNGGNSPQYRYNKGNKVLGLEFGDHIGDW